MTHLQHKDPAVTRLLASIFDASTRRLQLAHLSDLDDHLLDDIGLSRSDLFLARTTIRKSDLRNRPSGRWATMSERQAAAA